MSLFYLPPWKRHFYLALTVRMLPSCHPTTNTPPFPSHHEKKANRMTSLPQCQPRRAPAAHGPMPLCGSNARPPSRLTKRNRCPPSADPATGDSSRPRLRVQTHARRAVRCRRALPVRRTPPTRRRTRPADLGMPARIIGNASLLQRVRFVFLFRLLMSLYFNAGISEGSPPSGKASALHPFLIYDLTVTEPKRLAALLQILVLDRHHPPRDQGQRLP